MLVIIVFMLVWNNWRYSFCFCWYFGKKTVLYLFDCCYTINTYNTTLQPKRHWKSTFDFTKIVSKNGLKWGTVCRIVKFIFPFSLGCPSALNFNSFTSSFYKISLIKSLTDRVYKITYIYASFHKDITKIKDTLKLNSSAPF